MHVLYRYVKYIIAIVVLWTALYGWSTYGCHRVKGNYMKPTVTAGGFKKYQKGAQNIPQFRYRDLVLFYHYHTRRKGGVVYEHIGRVVGRPGDQIQLSGGELKRNGKLVPEEYIKDPGDQTTGTIVVPEDHLFVLSDNRNIDTRDSRAFGPIPSYLIIGKVDR